MTEKEKMLSGKLYLDHDDQLTFDYRKAKRLTRLFNTSREGQKKYRQQLLADLFGAIGAGCHIEPPFHCDFGCNTYIGDNFYANYDCIVLDPGKVTIGNNVFFAPRVCIYTAGHPLDAAVRNTRLEYGHAVTIGNDVWVGGSVVINPGVSIGDNVVIGSGSVVTKSIPSNVVAAGNPCKVLRYLTDDDKAFWQRQQQEWMRHTTAAVETCLPDAQDIY